MGIGEGLLLIRRFRLSGDEAAKALSNACAISMEDAARRLAANCM
jgi:hypothetical protein